MGDQYGIKSNFTEINFTNRSFRTRSKNVSRSTDSRQLLTRAWRTFCPQEKRTSILALIDTSFFQNGKEGFVFTQNALYIRETMHRVKVFPYDRINAIIYFQLFQRIQDRIAFQWKSTVKIMIMKSVMCY